MDTDKDLIINHCIIALICAILYGFIYTSVVSYPFSIFFLIPVVFFLVISFIVSIPIKFIISYSFGTPKWSKVFMFTAIFLSSLTALYSLINGYSYIPAILVLVLFGMALHGIISTRYS